MCATCLSIPTHQTLTVCRHSQLELSYTRLQKLWTRAGGGGERARERGWFKSRTLFLHAACLLPLLPEVGTAVLSFWFKEDCACIGTLTLGKGQWQLPHRDLCARHGQPTATYSAAPCVRGSVHLQMRIQGRRLRPQN